MTSEDHECEWFRCQTGKPAHVLSYGRYYCATQCRDKAEECAFELREESKLNAPSAQEEYEKAWRQKEELR